MRLLVFLLLAGCSQPEILERAKSYPEGQALLIGDSIVEGYWGKSLCGKILFNGGVGGTGAQEWSGMAPALIEELKPSLLVLSLGIVDARRNSDPEQWERDYRAIASSADILVSIAPVEHEKIEERPISDRVIADLNRRIAKVASETGAKLVPPIAGEDLTTDGIHLNERGYVQWSRNLESRCPR